MPSQPNSSPLHALAEMLRELRLGLEAIAKAADVDALDAGFAAFARIARSLPCGPPAEARRQLAEPALAWLSRTGKATDAGQAVIWSAAGAIVQTQRFASLTGPVRLYENRCEANAAWNAQQEVMRNAFHHEQQLLDLAALVRPHSAPADEATKSEEGQPGAAATKPLPQYVTLDQIAASVCRSKRTLENYAKRKTNPLPDPDIQGGGGKPNEWQWQRIRPWLETEFRRTLPEVFPAHRS